MATLLNLLAWGRAETAIERYLRRTALDTAVGTPLIKNHGHDFALLEWEDQGNSTHGPVVAYRILSSKWALSYLRYHAPDLTGSYMHDGERLDVCARPDGVMGTWRLAAYFSSELGDFNGLAMATWSVAEGGYTGSILFSNTSGVSGARLLFPHRDGGLRLFGRAYDLLLDYWKTVPLTTEDFPRLGESEAACAFLPPPPERSQPSAPELTGRYFSVFNETIAVCSVHGTMLAAFSGLYGLQGLAFALWNDGEARWEGLVADPAAAGGPAPFYWVATPGGGLAGEWTVYNRTWIRPANETVVPPWTARRAVDEPEPDAFAEGKLSLQHVCAVLEAASGARDVDRAKNPQVFAYPAMDPQAFAYPETGSVYLYPEPVFPVFNCTNSTSNATYECGDPAETHDVNGFFRRAPVEAIFAWAADNEEINETATSAPRAVVSRLELGDEVKFRVARLHEQSSGVARPSADEY